MKSKILSHVFLIIFFFAFSSTLIAQQSGKEIIRQSIEAIGGKEKLGKLKTVRVESVGHTNGLEQSERPEGPWLVSYDKTTTLLDFENERFQKERERSFIGSQDRIPIKTVINGGTGMRVFGERNIPMDHGSVEAEKDKWLMLPDRALLAASQSEDVNLLENTMLQGVQHHVVSYDYTGQRFLLFINVNTNLPTAIEVRKLSYLDIWGKVPYRTYFSYWFMQPGGLLYPYQFDTYHGNQPYETRSILNQVIHKT